MFPTRRFFATVSGIRRERAQLSLSQIVSTFFKTVCLPSSPLLLCRIKLRGVAAKTAFEFKYTILRLGIKRPLYWANNWFLKSQRDSLRGFRVGLDFLFSKILSRIAESARGTLFVQVIIRRTFYSALVVLRLIRISFRLTTDSDYEGIFVEFTRKQSERYARSENVFEKLIRTLIIPKRWTSGLRLLLIVVREPIYQCPRLYVRRR